MPGHLPGRAPRAGCVRRRSVGAGSARLRRARVWLGRGRWAGCCPPSCIWVCSRFSPERRRCESGSRLRRASRSRCPRCGLPCGRRGCPARRGSRRTRWPPAPPSRSRRPQPQQQPLLRQARRRVSSDERPRRGASHRPLKDAAATRPNPNASNLSGPLEQPPPPLLRRHCRARRPLSLRRRQPTFRMLETEMYRASSPRRARARVCPGQGRQRARAPRARAR